MLPKPYPETILAYPLGDSGEWGVDILGAGQFTITTQVLNQYYDHVEGDLYHLKEAHRG